MICRPATRPCRPLKEILMLLSLALAATNPAAAQDFQSTPVLDTRNRLTGANIERL